MGSEMVDRLASRFSAIVRRDLADVLGEVNARNAQRNDSTCATHDFCDANMLMDEAFTELFGHSMADELNDRVFAVVNAAWAKAKASGFSIVEGRG